MLPVFSAVSSRNLAWLFSSKDQTSVAQIFDVQLKLLLGHPLELLLGHLSASPGDT